MQVLFYQKEMDKNIEFTKKVYSMNDLEGYKIFFDKFLETEWKRDEDKKMNLEKFVEVMENGFLFSGKLFFGEDKNIPLRYVMSVKNDKHDVLFEMNCDLTGENYAKLLTEYIKIYGRCFHDSLLK